MRAAPQFRELSVQVAFRSSGVGCVRWTEEDVEEGSGSWVGELDPILLSASGETALIWVTDASSNWGIWLSSYIGATNPADIDCGRSPCPCD